MVRHELAGGEYNERRASCERVVEVIGKFLPEARALRDLALEDLEHYRSRISELDLRRCRHVITENFRVKDAKAALQSGDLVRLGDLMYLSHVSLVRDYDETRMQLNLIVSLARELDGVYGDRITGGGVGG